MIDNRWKTGAMVIALCIVLDQVSKILIETLLPYQEAVTILPFAALFRTWNDGIAFSMLASLGSWGLVLLAAIVICVVSYLWASSPKQRNLLDWGYAMIIGGALGNVIDRTIYGHVVDVFLFFVGNWSFAVFNLADVFITLGVIVIILDEILHSRKQVA